MPLATIREYVVPDVAILEDRGARTLMRCYSDDPHWLSRYLARLEMPFAVLETDELREALRALADEIVTNVNR